MANTARPGTKPTHDTAMFPGTIVRYKILPDGTKIIVSDIWDDPIGTVKWESVDPDNVRQGWRLCNGANGAPDLSGRVIMSIDNADKAGDGSESTIGNELDGEFPAVADGAGRNLLFTQDQVVDVVDVAFPNLVATDDNGDETDIDWTEAIVSRMGVHEAVDKYDIRPRARIMAAIERYK